MSAKDVKIRAKGLMVGVCFMFAVLYTGSSNAGVTGILKPCDMGFVDLTIDICENGFVDLKIDIDSEPCDRAGFGSGLKPGPFVFKDFGGFGAGLKTDDCAGFGAGLKPVKTIKHNAAMGID